MRKYIGFVCSLFILFAVLNCSRIQEKVEQKVNEKIDQKIDESMKKLDSGLNTRQLDSIMKSLDSINTNTKPKETHDDKRLKKAH